MGLIWALLHQQNAQTHKRHMIGARRQVAKPNGRRRRCSSPPPVDAGCYKVCLSTTSRVGCRQTTNLVMDQGFATKMERKIKLKSWLRQMLQQAQKGEKLPLPEELAIFYKDDEITIEKFQDMLKNFSCNMVLIPPPASLQPPTGKTVVATYQHHGRGSGRGHKNNKRRSQASSPTKGVTEQTARPALSEEDKEEALSPEEGLLALGKEYTDADLPFLNSSQTQVQQTGAYPEVNRKKDYTAGSADPTPLRCGSELDEGREASCSPSPERSRGEPRKSLAQ
ncbi:hypothetical protein Taro_023660 [Colocasia esculenta]|uniref:Uncharacterized protein n=1 Tax=Colocasia esculenta TaxID=4460 RepID=A0A843V4S1_COLES|nr:hypothetical protein [Colocasia esculenta]